MAFNEQDADGLAEIFENMAADAARTPHLPVGTSQADDALTPFMWRWPAVAEAGRVFGAARVAHKRAFQPQRGEWGEMQWEEVQRAARGVAAALRALEDKRRPVIGQRS